MFNKLWSFLKEAGPVLWGLMFAGVFQLYQSIDHYSHPTYDKYKRFYSMSMTVDSLGKHKEIHWTSDSVSTYSTATDVLLTTKIVNKVNIKK